MALACLTEIRQKTGMYYYKIGNSQIRQFDIKGNPFCKVYFPACALVIKAG
jgi:hypothetical protein